MYDHDDEIHPAPPSDAKTKTVSDKDALIADINRILKGPQSKEAESELITMIQKQRTLMLDIATQTFISKPNNPKLLDSINTLLAGLERTVRDDRKERLKDRELEDNKANFATFVHALNEVAAGKLIIPNYGNQAFVLDPLAPIIIIDDPDDEINSDELYQGHQIVNSKEIEETFDSDDDDDMESRLTFIEKDEPDDSEFDPDM